MKKKNKAQVESIAFFMVMVVVLVLTLLVSKIIMVKFNEALEEGNVHTTESRQAIVDMNVAFPTFDNAILVVLVLLTIGMIITSFLIPSHPIFVVVNVFGIFVLCFLGMVLSNMYKDIIDNSEDFAAVYSTFPKMTFVMNKLPWIAAVLVSIMTIVQYAKYRSDYG